jgi:hypothetical protein
MERVKQGQVEDMVKCGRLHQDEVQSPVRKTEDIKIEGRFGEGAVGTGLGLWSGAGERCEDRVQGRSEKRF